MTVRLGVAGATGRMGREVLADATDRSDVEPVLAVNRDPAVDAVAGVPVDPATEFEALLADRETDVVVEFTGPASTVGYAQSCAAAGVPLVSGTTGLSVADQRAIAEAAETVPIVRSSNFSRGIGVLAALVRDAVATLPEYDVEVVETHHAGKRDAPSGTAADLVDTVESARERAGTRVHGREGEHQRESGEIGVHSLRGGTVTGEHTVVLAGDGEQLRLEHRAGDRQCFAAGAVEAAIALPGHDPGRYDPAEVLE
jgi:4-hydroxy-tetrahydrodipicolinate reductase